MPELTPQARAASEGGGARAVSPADASRRAVLAEALWVSADVTVAVALVAMGLPPRWHTTLVGFTFLAVTWALVWRKDDERVRRAGLALGGLVLPGHLSIADVARSAARSLAWALGLIALVAVPFFFGWRVWESHFAPPGLSFALSVPPMEAANEVAGQLFVIALPEEAFYRGYLQSRLDDAWPPRWRVLGATVGPGLLGASVIFALGHVATVHFATRLAVFFPALLFGWLRARTGGIGASVCFHMLCNVYSQALGRGYGIY
jgi:membrane protease YdiL (CAAX protease family)